tara:strand:- start:863 stop:1126 length:264 start_codon:yes stop_codon:yes gene_type:complete
MLPALRKPMQMPPMRRVKDKPSTMTSLQYSETSDDLLPVMKNTFANGTHDPASFDLFWPRVRLIEQKSAGCESQPKHQSKRGNTSTR